MNVNIEITRDVERPGYATDGAAAFDLQVGDFLSVPDWLPTAGPGDMPVGMNRVTLGPNLQCWVGTGIRMDIPEGYGLLICPRSGLGAKRGLVLGNGAAVIDSDYTAEIKLALWNRGDQGIEINRGDRVAQAWLLPAVQANFCAVRSIEDSGRGAFGSTGG
ncbi:MAG: dUTP diphosphatase [Salinirussus sp.]